MSKFKALMFCLAGSVKRPSAVLSAAALPICFSWVLMVICLFIINTVDIDLGEANSSRSYRIGWNVAYSLAQNISSDVVAQKKSPAKIPIHIQAPQRQIEEMTTRLGGRFVQSKENAQLNMTWHEGRWILTSPVPGDNILLYRALREELDNSTPSIHNKFTFVSLRKQVERNKEGYVNLRDKATMALVPMGVIVPIMMLMFLSAASMTLDVATSRSSGYFECLALVPMPFWIFLLAKSTAQGLHIAMASTLILLASMLFIPIPPPATILLFFITTAIAGTTLSMMGGSLVFIWRTKLTRSLGGVVFVPIMSLIIWWFLSTVSGYFDFTNQSGKTPSTGQLGVLLSSPGEALGPTLVVLTVCAGLIASMCKIVEWRLGARRYGLSSL